MPPAPPDDLPSSIPPAANQVSDNSELANEEGPQEAPQNCGEKAHQNGSPGAVPTSRGRERTEEARILSTPIESEEQEGEGGAVRNDPPEPKGHLGRNRPGKNGYMENLPTHVAYLALWLCQPRHEESQSQAKPEAQHRQDDQGVEVQGSSKPFRVITPQPFFPLRPERVPRNRQKVFS